MGMLIKQITNKFQLKLQLNISFALAVCYSCAPVFFFKLQYVDEDVLATEFPVK